MAVTLTFAMNPAPNGEGHSVEIPMRGFLNLKIHVDNPTGQDVTYKIMAKGHPEAMFWATLVENGTVTTQGAAIVEVASHYPVVKLELLGQIQGVLVWASLSNIMEN